MSFMRNPAQLGLRESEPQLKSKITIENLAEHASNIKSVLQSEQVVPDLPKSMNY